MEKSQATGSFRLGIGSSFCYATLGKEKPVAQDDLLRRVPDIPDERWPFPFPRSDWDQAPPSVRAFLLSLLSRVEALEAKLS